MNEKRESGGETTLESSQKAWSRSPNSEAKASSASGAASTTRWTISTRPVLAARAGRQREEVRDQLRAMLGADRLGMELDAPGAPVPVADRHQRPVIGPPDRFELARQRR